MISSDIIVKIIPRMVLCIEIASYNYWSVAPKNIIY